MKAASSAVAPITSAERMGELDVLRGFALLGVLVANITEFAIAPWMASEAQIAALPTAAPDALTSTILQWLVYDKANTLFATLFGIGFWVQMERLNARGAKFEKIYLRRLLILLAFGYVHMLLIWTWDILQLYAAAGIILLMMRKVSMRTMLVLGIFLAVFGSRLTREALDGAGLMADSGSLFEGSAILTRQSLSQAGDYFGLVGHFSHVTLYAWFGGGIFAGWVAYALGRFLIGAYIARRGWVARAKELLVGYRKVLLLALPLGLLGQGIYALIENGYIDPFGEYDLVADIIHYVSVPLLALGYACAMILLFHSALQPLVSIFAPVGRMALTNYVIQSFFIAFVLFGVGPGLALAGKIGTTALTGWSLAFFAFQIIASHFWLKTFNYGPLEYLWRWATYGSRPRLRPASRDGLSTVVG